MSAEVKDFFDLCQTDVEMKVLGSNDLVKWANDAGLADESLIKFLKDSKQGTKDLASYQEYLKTTGKQTSRFADLTQKAGNVVKGFGAALASMAVMWAIGEVISVAVKAIDSYVNRVKIAKEAVADAKGNFDSLRSELQSINEELETNKDRISELNKLPSLTYVEQGELDKLKEATKELERQRDIKNIELKRAAEDLSESNHSAFDKEYGDNNFSYSDVMGLDSEYGSLSMSPTSDVSLAQEGLEGLAAAIIKVQEAQKQAQESDDSEWLDSLTEREKYYKGQLEDNLSTLQGYRDNLTEIMDYRDLTDDEQAFYDNLEQGIRLIYQFADPSAWNQIEFDQIFNNESIDVTKEKLIELAQSGELDEKSIDQFTKLNEILKQTDFILGDGETAVSSFVDQIEALASSNDSLTSSQDVVNKSFISEFENLPTDKIEEYISLVKSGNIDEGTISSFSELNNLMQETGMSAEDAAKALKDYADGYKLSTDLTANIQDAYDLLKDVGEQYEKTGIIGLSSLESIANKYPQLRSAVNEYTQGLISADDMIGQLQTAYDNDANAYRVSMANRLSTSTEFFSSIYNNNKSLFDDLANAYGFDVSNWKTMAQAKAEIDQKLIQSLSAAWSKYYSIVFDSASGMASVEGVAGSAPEGSHGEMSKAQRNALDSAFAATDKYNDIVNKLNEAANITVNVPDFGGIGSVGSKSGSGSKDKKDTEKETPIDWAERHLDMLNEKRQELVDSASKYSSEYVQQIIALDKQILPETQKTVEAYKKVWEDATSKISKQDQAKIELGSLDISTYSGDYGENVQAAIDAYDKYRDMQKQYAEAEKNSNENLLSQYDADIAKLENKNETLESQNSLIESQIDYYKEIGSIISASDYETMLDNVSDEIDNVNDKVSDLKSKLNLARELYGSNSEEYDDVKDAISDAEDELYSLKKTQAEYNKTLAEMPITNLSTIISMYEDIGSKIENYGKMATATGQKLNADYYQELISNQSTVLDQYKKQIKEIKSLMREYEKGSENWQELYDQLQQIDSSMVSIVENMARLNEELLQMPLDSISTYSDSLQKVISGLTDVRSELDSATSAITGAISDQIDLLEEEQKAQAETQQKVVDGLQEKYDLLVKTNEALEKQLAIEQDEYDLARAKNQKTNVEIRDGKKVYTSDNDAVRQAEEALANSKADLEEYNLQKQIEDAKTALDNLNDGYQDQIDVLEKISKKYSEISSAAEKISNANLATSLFGEGFVDKVLSGNDKEIYSTLTSLYQTNAEQLEQYQKQADSTLNIQSLIEDYVNSYKAGEITYEQAMTKINGLLSQMNESMSAMDNLQNIYDYLGTVNGVGADADSILKGIQDGLSVTADELVKSLEQYNKNSGMISEYSSSWEQLTDNVKSMLDVLKEVRDNLRDDEDDSDDDDDDDNGAPFRKGTSGYVDSGPGVYAKGVENGPVGKASSSDREKMIKYLATNELKKGEVPILAHTGEQILNEQQKMMLLKNFENASMYRPVTPNFSNDLSNLVVKSGSQGDININYGDMTFPNVQNAEDVVKEFTKMTDQALRQVVSKYK